MIKEKPVRRFRAGRADQILDAEGGIPDSCFPIPELRNI